MGIALLVFVRRRLYKVVKGNCFLSYHYIMRGYSLIVYRFETVFRRKTSTEGCNTGSPDPPDNLPECMCRLGVGIHNKRRRGGDF